MLTAALAFLATASARAATFNISNGDVPALINAIKKANSNHQDDTIELASNGTYTLTASYSGVDGLPVIGPDGGKKLTIHGNGASIQRDDNATQPFRIIRFAKGASVTVSGLTITGGYVDPDPGAGIYNDGTLTLTQCGIVDNDAGIFGNGRCGGVYNAGSLTVADSSVSGNVAEDVGGICNDGSLIISNSEINRNSANGIIGIISSNTLTIIDSNIDYNSAADVGFDTIVNLGSATITNSSISGNTADCPTGGIVNSGSMQLTNCIINNNTNVSPCIDGGSGAISNGGPLTITNCTISGNTPNAARGGAVDNGGGTVMLENSTLSQNGANSGGAIYNDSGGSVVVTNCTLSQNGAGGDSFGDPGRGGGIYNAGSLTVTNSTLSDNAALSGGDTVYNSGNSAVTKLANTILKAGSSGTNLGNDNGGSISSLGYNLSNDNGSGFLTATGDRINTNPMLGRLQDNGGPTFTQELLLGSPAIGAGDPTFNPNSFSPPLLYDQRGPGFVRVANGRVDIGAFEVQVPFETEKLAVQAITPRPSGVSPAQWSGVFNAAAASGGAGTYFNATAVGNYVTYTVPVAQPGTYRVRVRIQTKPNKGKFQLAINGVKQGFVQDEYSTSVGYAVRDLGTVAFLTAGNEAFKFSVAGKNSSSSGYTLAFDYIELIPTTRSETESLNVQSKTPPPSGVNPAQWSGVFNASAASGGAGTYFNANAVGNYITYTVPVAKAGTYHVRVGIQTKRDKGIFQLAINGMNVGQPQDEYASTVTYDVRDLGTVSFSAAGNYGFKFTVTGKNPSSTGYTLGFDYIELVP